MENAPAISTYDCGPCELASSHACRWLFLSAIAIDFFLLSVYLLAYLFALHPTQYNQPLDISPTLSVHFRIEQLH